MQENFNKGKRGKLEIRNQKIDKELENKKNAPFTERGRARMAGDSVTK